MRKRRNPDCDYQRLEPRKLMASVTWIAGALNIQGTGIAETVVVKDAIDPESGDPLINIRVNGVNSFFTRTSVFLNEIHFSLEGGDDYFRNFTSLHAVGSGGAGNDRLIGGPSNDQLFGDSGEDVINGRENGRPFGISQIAFEELHGGAQEDVVKGGDGDDLIYGDHGEDLLIGADGNDSIYGGAGKDKLRGADGDDYLVGGPGSDIIFGDAGDDTIVFNSNGHDWVDPDDRNSDANTAESNRIVFRDVVAGTKTVRSSKPLEFSFRNISERNNAGIELDLNETSAQIIQESNGDLQNFRLRLTNPGYVTSVIGSDFDDTMSGYDGHLKVPGQQETLRGHNGNDILKGNAGRDRLFGSFGNDSLYGGGGIDELYTGEGHDGLFGGKGADKLFTSNINDNSIRVIARHGEQDLLWGKTVADFFEGHLNNPDVHIPNVGGFFLKGWRDVEDQKIEAMDAGLRQIHHEFENARLFQPLYPKHAVDGPISDGFKLKPLIELNLVYTGDPDRLGGVRSGPNSMSSFGIIEFYEGAFQDAARINSVIVHELAHLWSFFHCRECDQKLFQEFIEISEFSQDDGSWTTPFSDGWFADHRQGGSAYGATSPLEDLATCWTAFFLGSSVPNGLPLDDVGRVTYEPSSADNTVEQARLELVGKMQILDSFFQQFRD